MLNKLKEIGLNEKEALVYLELLKLGTQPASIIARRLDIPKSTGNFNLEVLVKKNFATKTKKGTSFLYTAEDPVVIIDMLDYKKKKQISEIDNKIKSAKSLITELKSIQFGNVQKPEITFYESTQDLYKIFDSIINEAKKTGEIMSFVKILPESNDIEEQNISNNFIKKRIANKIKSKVLAIDSIEAQSLKKTDTKELRETRIVKELDLDFEGGEIFFCGKSMHTITSHEGKFFAFTVSSSVVYKLYKSLFMTAWNSSK
jgi:sugar-specific transcriptional regulator TrmB